ncbi:PIR protein [Plasmodium yoelii]|uniref:PIR protein n=3 Tax=Plasmodium yoelii TaxID=5861 RepID=A0AAE9X049_PLAYO|nr:PIR protein [Plasmodium yoelii]EAA21371.1 putative bir1 protein [Plasmodium yoelii yoelii]WBY61389.1 PIR protein [Plasmodium yoelii yoelii]VTZ82042.1 PIR protein [Plasmodium yoelii]|eukprot:XP_034493644.1 PIR protein [Plasmodium yoelii]
MTLNVCKAFILFEDFLPDNFSFENNNVKYKLYEAYCPIDKETQSRKCRTGNQAVSGATVFLFNYLFADDQYIETDDKNNEYIMYIMLWLSNKMKLLTHGTYGAVSEFYVTFMRDNEHYKKYLSRINKSQKIMNIKIGEMRILYGLLNELCNAIINYSNDSSNCPDFLKFVNNWENQYNQLINRKKKFFEDEYYCEVLLTLKSAYQKFKQDNNIPKNFPEIKEGDIAYCKKIRSETNTSWKVIAVESREVKKEKGLEKGKDSFGYIDVFKKTFETYSSNFIITFSSIRNSLYKKAVPPLTNFYGKIMNYVSEYFNNIVETYTSYNGMPESQPVRYEPSSSNDSSSPQDYGIKVSENGTTEIGDNPLIVYKKMGFSILIILIPIALAIMYKYLPFGWRKKSKKKKKMKKAINMFDTNETTEEVINPTDRKKQMQIIINLSSQNKQGKKLTNSSIQKKQDKKLTNSSTQKKQDNKFINSNNRKKKVKIIINSYTQKKQTKDFINSIYWEKYPLLNIYKLMKADPVPFIILFLLFIFYVYKRKDDSLE